MNGISTGQTEQFIGKFHVTNVEKLPNGDNHSDENLPLQDEIGCGSRFQMIRVDRNFGRGRWKVNDYQPPETTTNSSVNPTANETNNLQLPINGESNVSSSVMLTAAHFQRRMSLNNPPTVVPPGTGLLHHYSPGTIPNQSFLLSNHPHQFGYYPFYPPPFSPYAPPWPAALAASNPYLQAPTLAPAAAPPPVTSKHNDIETGINGDNTYSNLPVDLLQNPHLSAYLYASYLPQTSSTLSSYATIPSYHPIAPLHPTILPQKTLPLSQNNNNTNHHSNDSSQQILLLTSPKSNETKSLDQPAFLVTPKTKPNEPEKITQIPDLISCSPITIAPSNPSSTTTATTTTTALNDIWTYSTAASPLNLTQTTAATAVTAIELLNTKTNSNTEITNEFFKELTTPIIQNNTTDIDNKISAAMDLVKMHLLSAVREEVTELREQIRSLNEKISHIEHENAFLRQHISNEIYAQYIPLQNSLLSSSSSSSSSNDSTNSMPNNQIAMPLFTSSSQLTNSS